MPEPFAGSSMKQLWLQKHTEYFNTPPDKRAELGLKFPVPREYGVNPRDPQIKQFLSASLGGADKLTDYEEAADIHGMIFDSGMSGGENTAASGTSQLSKRLAELGYANPE